MSISVEDPAEAPIRSLWKVAQAPGQPSKSFVDLQNDATAKDIEIANREGFISVEHMKRYTSLGMATDQVRPQRQRPRSFGRGPRRRYQDVGTTTFRPPTPLLPGAMAGRHRGSLQADSAHADA